MKLENMKMKTLMNEKINCDKIEEVQNKEMENEVESNMEETNDCGLVEENKCEKCDFVGKNKTGLKVHVTAKHREKPLMQMFSRVSKNS